jgi:hypothetical protein
MPPGRFTSGSIASRSIGPKIFAAEAAIEHRVAWILGGWA